MPKIKPEQKTFLFHKDTPQGQAFPTSQVELLVKDGWTDSPAKLNIEPAKPEIKKEQVENADPSEIASLAKTLGYHVFTEVELIQYVALNAPKAEPAKELADYSNDELISEAEKRGLKKSDPVEEDQDLSTKEDGPEQDMQELQSVFDEDPEALTKPQLVLLGNTKFKLGLRESMLEKTLIEKITNAMNAE